MARRKLFIFLFATGISVSGCDAPPSAPSHLVLITVDTLRADRLGCYGNAAGLTPNLDALAKRAVLFTSAYATAPSTMASVATILTGNYAEKIGIFNNSGRLPPNVVTLATHLKKNGWRTGAVISSAVLTEPTGFNRGFDVYNAKFPQLEAVRKLPERIAEDTTDALLETASSMLQGGGSIFLWVHFQDPHGPYTPPEELASRYLEIERREPDGGRLLPLSPDYRGIGGIPDYQYLGGPRDAAHYRAAYDGEVRYLDESLGRLFDGLANLGILQEAVLVFTADHGEGLGEQDYWFAHGEYLSAPLLHVPLLIVAPGLEADRREELVSLLDLVPTLAGLIDVDGPSRVAGRDLFAPDAEVQEGSAYFSTYPEQSTVPRRGLARGGYKYVTTAAGPQQGEKLVALNKEDENLIQAEPQIASAMRSAYMELRNEIGVVRAVEKRSLSPAEREKLRALGYVAE